MEVCEGLKDLDRWRACEDCKMKDVIGAAAKKVPGLDIAGLLGLRSKYQRCVFSQCRFPIYVRKQIGSWKE